MITLNYQGKHNRIPTEREIIRSYHSLKAFLFDREEWHLNTSMWYQEQAELNIQKARQHKQQAKSFQAQALDYWALAFDASLAILRREKAEQRKEVQRVAR